MVIAIIVISAVLFLWPGYQKIQQTNNQLKESKQRLTLIEQRKDILSPLQLGENASQLDTQLTKVDQYLPISKPSLQALISLTQLARLERVQMSGITLEPGKIDKETLEDKVDALADQTETETKTQKSPAKTERLKDFTITFSLTGDKTNLNSYITKIKEISPLMKIEEFTTSFTGGDPSASSSAMRASLKLLVYYQEMPQQMPAADKPFEKLTEQEELFLTQLEDYLFLQANFQPTSSGAVGTNLGVSNPFAKGAR